jgi:inner membrane protein
MDIQIWMLWMIFAALMIVGEIFTAGFFVLWFGVGAIVAGILALLGFSTGWQLGSFVAVSFVLLLVSRRFADKISKPQPDGIGADRFVGQTGFVLEAIDNLANTGSVRVGQEKWRAESYNKKTIPAKSSVTVVETSGTHLIVKLTKGE